MKQIPFYKMVASGNDFVVVDNRGGIVPDLKAFTRTVCDRHEGIGADGVILVEKTRGANYRMRIINSDGSEAEACGNGFRCVALLAHERLGFPARHEFEAVAGRIQAGVHQNRVRVRMVEPHSLLRDKEISVLGKELRYQFLNTGVPHAVFFVEGLGEIPVEVLGREIRFHSEFSPRGTNVNFVEITGPKQISVRTYERGVEAETLACGSGSTASAILSAEAGYVTAPVFVKTQSGEILKVDFKKNGQKFTNVFLEGEARLVFEGKV